VRTGTDRTGLSCHAARRPFENGRQLGSRCPKLGRKGHGASWGRYDAPRAADGRRWQEELGPFARKGDADGPLADAVQAIGRGTYLRPERDLTVARYLDEWLEGKTRPEASTRHGYRRRHGVDPGAGRRVPRHCGWRRSLRDVAFDRLPRPAPLGGRRAALGRRRPRQPHRHHPLNPSAGRQGRRRRGYQERRQRPHRQPRRRHRRRAPGPRRRQAELRLQLGSAWVDTGLVFTKADGGALVPDSVSQRFDRLVIRTGLPPVRLHDLRHLAASLTYRATRDLKLTSQMLGHASTAITEVYTSVFEDVEREAAEQAAALVPRAHRTADAAPVPTSCPPAAAGARCSGGAMDEAAGLVIRGGAGGARTHDPGIMRRLKRTGDPVRLQAAQKRA